jgi:hypothetical protein
MRIEELRSRREEILHIAAQHGARHVRVFGSVARGEADERSDVDFLVDLETGRSLLDFGGLLMDLQSLLSRPVDVVTEKGLKSRIRNRVLGIGSWMKRCLCEESPVTSPRLEARERKGPKADITQPGRQPPRPDRNTASG